MVSAGTCATELGTFETIAVTLQKMLRMLEAEA